MSSAASDSSISGPAPGDSPANWSSAEIRGGSQVWLDGEVLSCACPDCGAPMVVRLWLRLAECRLCGAQVEVTEELERQAQKLLAQRERRGPWSDPVLQRDRPPPLPILAPPKAPSSIRDEPPPPNSPQSASPTLAKSAPRLVAQPVVEPAGPLVAEVVGPAAAAPVAVVAAAPARVAPSRPSNVSSGERALGRRMLDYAIASLLSTLFHMLVMILLGMLVFRMPKPPRVYLEVDLRGREAGPQGGELVVKAAKNESLGRESVSIATAPRSVGEQITLFEKSRSQAVASLNVSVTPPNLAVAPAAGGGSVRPGTLISGRDPAVRAQTLAGEGGSEQTELAVAMGLKWLAKHQHRDGHWSLDQFHDTGDCGGRCGDAGLTSDTSATALALLPFLGAGYTHRDGAYQETVEKGLHWLVTHDHPEWGLMGDGYGRMYAHGQAAIALCEAYALTHDSKLRFAAQRAVDFIVAAQHRAGGWRYMPGEEGDLSVVGWQLMALRSAQMGDLNVPKETIRLSDRFLDSVQMNTKVARFSYMPAGNFTETMTAEGMLCRLYSGRSANDPSLLAAADWLLRYHPPSRRQSNMYYWYYATQVMHHLGGSRWKTWNAKMKALLLETQETDGHKAGSWTPHEHHDVSGGRLYMTALAVCTLEVYYRHLPLYKHQALLK